MVRWRNNYTQEQKKSTKKLELLYFIINIRNNILLQKSFIVSLFPVPNGKTL